MATSSQLETVKSLLIKARSTSGATEAERVEAKNMAARLMKKYEITPDQLKTPVQAKPDPNKRRGGERYTYTTQVLWYHVYIPPSVRAHGQKLDEMNELFEVFCIKHGIRFEVGYDRTIARMDNIHVYEEYKKKMAEFHEAALKKMQDDMTDRFRSTTSTYGVTKPQSTWRLFFWPIIVGLSIGSILTTLFI